MVKKKGDTDDTRVLTLECSKCGWEWTVLVDAESPPGSPSCPKCFHNKVYLKNIM